MRAQPFFDSKPWATDAPRLPAFLVVGIGALWGIYWIPLRHLNAILAAGPWLTCIVVLIGCLVLTPFAWKGRKRLAASSSRALFSTALGGASFVLYSNGLLYGHVAVVILLFYLTPIWSTLIARFWLGWPVSWWRYLAIGLGLVGIALVLRASHQGLPLPRTLGDVLGLASGLLWSLASTGINVHSRTRAAETTFVFCLGGVGMALVLALGLGHISSRGLAAWPSLEGLFWSLLVGGLWWGTSLTGFMWACRRLEPARVGILLMSEVIVGALSAALWAEEPFGAVTWVGAILVLAAGTIETLTDQSRGRPGQDPQRAIRSQARPGS